MNTAVLFAFIFILIASLAKETLKEKKKFNKKLNTYNLRNKRAYVDNDLDKSEKIINSFAHIIMWVPSFFVGLEKTIKEYAIYIICFFVIMFGVVLMSLALFS